MSRSGRSTEECGGPTLRGLYRDRENGWIFGVCAGFSEFANFRTTTVRIIAVLCLVFFFVPTALIYIAATLLIRQRPLTYSGTRAEHEFWKNHHCNDRWRAS
ncbi:MAG: PspC domain-containing protein [Woeseia sp.]